MTNIWARALQSAWGIQGDLTQLDGEYDLNFMVNAPDGVGYVLKVMRVECDPQFIEMQVQAMEHIRRLAPSVRVPAVIPTIKGAYWTTVEDNQGNTRILWLIERCGGLPYANVEPKTETIIAKIGHQAGEMSLALRSFDHPALQRDFKWNLMTAGWVARELHVVDDPRRQAILYEICAQFEMLQDAIQTLSRQAIHNDLNDYNILVASDLKMDPDVSGIIDFGDMCTAPRICELAIAGAYLVLDHPDPERALASLVAGYHQVNPLSEAELGLIWPLLRMRLAVSVVNSTQMAIETPDDPYVVISQAPAWRFLEAQTIDEGLLVARLRYVCGFSVTTAAARIDAWLQQTRGSFAPILAKDLSNAPVGDLSVNGAVVPRDPFDLTSDEAATLGQGLCFGDQIWLGHYREPRLIYTAPEFRLGPWRASNRRTVHLGIDVFAPAGHDVNAPMDGTVHVVENRAANLDYGGVVILRHETPNDDSFYTLYGHLDPEVCERLEVGQTVLQGAFLAKLGHTNQSGGWAPHLHFQMAMTLDGLGKDWPGVADPDDIGFWEKICPNPAALLNLPDAKVVYNQIDKMGILESRKRSFGANLKLSYRQPVMFSRGWKHHLFDEWGRPHLDAYNNVPHVGHAHPRLQAVASDQMARMNSNTRYLHPAQIAFADKIVEKMPDDLSVCYFVNSGTEANELALRLARAWQGGKDMITPNHGYHGNTTGAIDISAYKFNAKGGVGQPDWVHLVDIPDDYRGKFGRCDPERGHKFAAQVGEKIGSITAKKRKLAGFIAETFPSVGGQIIPPPGYLADVYSRVRAVGGLCIADEVQTGLGRLGGHYFAFEQQGVTPDIVVLGKPIGNGHPLGVVVTRPEIAARFAEGPEFFSTFGGSTLSCRIGREVLQIVDDERLQENARLRGTELLSGLRDLQTRHEVIGDVRGMGLFIGVELVQGQKDKEPAKELASYVLNRMREYRILIGTEGPHDNILKIRPPLTIDAEGVEMILNVLGKVLSETPCRI